MQPSVYLLTIFLPLGAIIAVFAMKYWSAVQQAKARLANDEAYRQLAEQAAAAQAEAARTLAEIRASLAEVSGRVASIEQVLKQVE